MKKKVIITGGAGFVGSNLIPLLQKRGYHVVVIDRRPPNISDVDFVEADIASFVPRDERLENPYAYIHLAGKNIFGTFTAEHKQAIYDSRVIGTEQLVELFKKEIYRPRVIVGASAVGYYGNQGDTTLHEGSLQGDTFLSHVVHDWETAYLQAQLYGVRVVLLRQGHILGDGGFLRATLPLYRKGFGGSIGSGKQWLPWIAIKDLMSLYMEALENRALSGIYNAVVRTQIRYRDFSKTLAKVVHKPNFLRVPRWLLAIRFGREFAREMTVSQRVVSHRLPQFDYRLQWNDLEHTLRDILEK